MDVLRLCCKTGRLHRKVGALADCARCPMRPTANHRRRAPSPCGPAKFDMRSSTMSLAALRHRNSLAYVTEKIARQLNAAARTENRSASLEMILYIKALTRSIILAAHVAAPTQLPHTMSALYHPYSRHSRNVQLFELYCNQNIIFEARQRGMWLIGSVPWRLTLTFWRQCGEWEDGTAT